MQLQTSRDPITTLLAQHAGVLAQHDLITCGDEQLVGPWTHLSFRVPFLWAVPRLDGVPGLTWLGLDVAFQPTTRWYRCHEALDRIHCLAIRASAVAEVARALEVRRVLALEVVADGERSLDLEVGWRAVLSRETAPGPWTAAVIRWVPGGDLATMADDLRALRAALPASVTRVVVE